MDESWYAIKDLHDFIDHVRLLVFSSFGETNQEVSDNLSDIFSTINPENKEEMDRVLSYEESYIIVKDLIKEKTNKKTHKTKRMINNKILLDIIESLNSRMISNILNKLVNDGVLETGFDQDANDFVFWVSEKDKNE